MALVLILADGTEIELADATYNKHYVINCTNRNDFSEKRSAMTKENLSEVKILEDGEEVADLIGLTLTGVQEVLNPDNTVTAHFYFTGGRNVTNEYAEAGKILIGDDNNEPDNG